jgi:hypothetical protein
MSIGTAAIAATVSANAKTLRFTGDIAWFRKLATVTLSGHTGSPANFVFMVYRGSTKVTQAVNTPGGNTFSLDLNTTEMLAFFPATVDYGAVRDFRVLLFDADETSLESIGEGVLSVRQTADYGDTVPTSPISATTTFVGNMAFYNGASYLYNPTTLKYHEFRAAGVTGEAGFWMDPTGIDIPGAPLP